MTLKYGTGQYVFILNVNLQIDVFYSPFHQIVFLYLNSYLDESAFDTIFNGNEVGFQVIRRANPRLGLLRSHPVGGMASGSGPVHPVRALARAGVHPAGHAVRHCPNKTSAGRQRAEVGPFLHFNLFHS